MRNILLSPTKHRLPLLNLSSRALLVSPVHGPRVLSVASPCFSLRWIWELVQGPQAVLSRAGSGTPSLS